MFNAQTARVETYNGTAWDYPGRTQSYNPTPVNAAASVAGKYAVQGDWVTGELTVTFTGAATGTVNVPAPITPSSGSGTVVGTCQMTDASAGTTSRLAGIVTLSSSNQFVFQALNGNPNAYATAVTPWTWAAGDTIVAVFNYRRA